MRLPGATYRRKWPSLIFTAVASTCRRTWIARCTMPNPQQAARWLNAAAAQGNDEAKRMLSEQQTSAKAAIPEGLPPVDGSCTAVDEAELQRTENDPDIQA
jgi:TPR repeat protein